MGALGRKYIKKYEVAATRAVISAYRLLGSEGFSRLFRLLGDTWQGDIHSLTAPVISGMAPLLKTYGMVLSDSLICVDCAVVAAVMVFCTIRAKQGRF